MNNQIIGIIVEKGLLALIIAIAGYWINKKLELSKQKALLENKINEKKIEEIETQLSQFYYPIYFRLEKDSALWRLSSQLSSKGSLPQDANPIIESEYILKNHNEVVSIIESKIHLAQVDEPFRKAVNDFLKHIAVYNTIRKVASLKNFNPIDLGAPYPKEFARIVRERIKALQDKQHTLLTAASTS